MIDVNGMGYQGAMLIFGMLDELAKELGYGNGAQDLIAEEPAVNVELLAIVQERLIAQAEFRRLAAVALIEASDREVSTAYQ